MKHWIFIGLHSIVFAGCLTEFVVSPGSFLFLLGILFFNVVVAKRTIFHGSFAAMIIPGVYSLCAGLLLFFVDTVLGQYVFASLSTMLFLLTLRTEYYVTGESDVRAERGLFAAGTMGAMFLFFTSMQGFMINFTLPLWMFLAAFACVVYAVSFAYYSLVRGENRSTLYSFILALFFVQFAWIVQFWPFGYLTSGTVALIFYYVLWDILDRYAEGTFSRHHAIVDVVLLTGFTVLVLATSRWTPLY